MIGINWKGGRAYSRMQVASNDVDVLEKFQRVIGCGSVRLKKKAVGAHAAQYVFSLTRREQVRDAFMAMYPHLGARRQRRGLEVLAECAQVKSAPYRRATDSPPNG
jgi:hypothetical protein